MSDPSINILSRFVKELLGGVLAAADGTEIRSVFIGGSVAGGEVSCRTNGEMVEFYSDVDMYVVVGDDADADGLRSKCAFAGASVPLSGDNFVFFRGPDVGVYTFESLAGQPARPGTVGLDKRHMILYGDREIPIHAAEKIGNVIARQEALYLLEHRLLELFTLDTANRSTNTDNEGYRAFMVCKTCLDVVAASLIELGHYVPGRTDRMRCLLALGMSEETGWDDTQLELVTRCDNAMRKMPAPDWFGPVTGEHNLEAAIRLALGFWKSIAAKGSNDWSSTLLRRCCTGEYMNNFRQFRTLNSRFEFKRRGGLVTGASLARYSPVSALRMSALIEYLDRYEENRPESDSIKRSLGPYLDKLTRVCGYGEGELIERTNQMYRTL